jgi:hypothetical protein
MDEVEKSLPLPETEPRSPILYPVTMNVHTLLRYITTQECTYNITLRRVRVTAVAVEKK